VSVKSCVNTSHLVDERKIKKVSSHY